MAAQKERCITAEDLYRFRLITDCQISPDGKHIVYSVHRVDQKTEKKCTNLWIVPTDGAHPRQFTHGDQADSHPRWSPDGKHLVCQLRKQDPDAIEREKDERKRSWASSRDTSPASGSNEMAAGTCPRNAGTSGPSMSAQATPSN
jgi:Tol biopolymer transport system component